MNTQVRQKTSFVPASKSPAAPKSRRPSLSRADSEDRLITAAIDLLKTQNAAEISVRQIAQVADVNHGLIHSYFGSKANLFAKAGSRLLGIVMEQIVLRSTIGDTPLSVEAKMFVNIGIWMLTTGESPKTMGVDGTVLKVVKDNFTEKDGVAAESAETLAFIAISMICAGQMVPLLGLPIGDVNFESVHKTWRHMVMLLAANPIQSAT